MSGLAGILTIPRSASGLMLFHWNHWQHHLAIVDAARQTGKGNLAVYQIWPVNPDAMQDFLNAHQSFHGDMDALYHIAGSDLSELDWNNERAVAAWAWQNQLEHRQVAQASGLPI